MHFPNTTPEKDKAATDAAWGKGFLCGVFAMIILSPIVKGGPNSDRYHALGNELNLIMSYDSESNNFTNNIVCLQINSVQINFVFPCPRRRLKNLIDKCSDLVITLYKTIL